MMITQTKNNGTGRGSLLADVKALLSGREVDVLRALAPEAIRALDATRHVHCPLPYHLDEHPSFRWDCNKQCFHCTCGSYDLFAYLQKANCWEFSETLSRVAGHLGVTNGNPKQPEDDPLETVCQQKRIPLDAAKLFGARTERQTVVVPQYDSRGEQCSTTTISPWGTKKQRKGLNAAGKPAGMHLPHNPDGKVRLPQAGESWFLVESFKCAAALHQLGFLVAGMNGKQIKKEYARLFFGCVVTIVHHLDKPGVSGAKKSAERLYGTVSAVRIARMQGETKDKEGTDVRDVLAGRDGERIVHQAIEDAAAWTPGGEECVLK